MKNKALYLLLLFVFSAAEVFSQAARNIPRDAGPVQWTFGNIIVFIVFPILLIVFLFFYVKKLTRDKIEEKEFEDAEEAEKPEN